ncbi:magnesium transporter MgtE N-terminal domain-containing protein [Arthrobacter bambusae]|uniref:magnesium transporter MgtE N-terminal domain-containing protein n=1 Tax=Arthrobacter bambusae TaxID=1338426 RepID=UPI0027849706|nr:CBS domain-containing protein [Arthrobacter bambusae]MDQ0030298.1 CBS domain-containing protein/sporulation protein YlmC with PRC-barrel domain [Arthrobacter bambusae]MDQ0097980.1 CBS domain-containing protein/sporulation protein YlmC with PRC-barrel domain [Arthrobacter bambusae]
MSTNPSRVFVARLLGLDVFDPVGDRLGRLRDVVVLSRGLRGAPHAVGIVVEVPGKKRVFVPMTRLTSMDQAQIICTGLVNLRRFQQRGAEQLVVGELFDRKVTLKDGSGDAIIEDIALDQQRNGEWLVSKLFVRRGTSTSRLRGLRRGHTLLVDWAETLQGSANDPQGASHFVATHEDLKPADFADALQEMSDKRRIEVASELQDERLADVLQELPEEDQVTLLSALDNERAADVLEEMDPDDAADLLADLPSAKAEELLLLMEPDEADDVRRLLQYDEDTAGGLMTPVPVILPPEATVAEALAHVRSEELSPALASAIFICRPPLETPTGRFLGVVHIQQLLRSAPPEQLGSIVDKNLEPVSDHASVSEVSHTMASYNLNSLPVVNSAGRLVGAVTVDDLLDHLLPDDWRTHDDGAPIRKLGGRIG